MARDNYLPEEIIINATKETLTNAMHEGIYEKDME